MGSTRLRPCAGHSALLRVIVKNGWSWEECRGALACEIPPGEAGDKMRDFNVRVVEGAGGYLAPVSRSDLQVLTARGSHTTQAVRALLFSTKSMHDELASPDGTVSRAIVTEKRPSIDEPLTKGLEYTVIRWELVVECPRLMSVRTLRARHAPRGKGGGGAAAARRRRRRSLGAGGEEVHQ